MVRVSVNEQKLQIVTKEMELINKYSIDSLLTNLRFVKEQLGLETD